MSDIEKFFTFRGLVQKVSMTIDVLNCIEIYFRFDEICILFGTVDFCCVEHEQCLSCLRGLCFWFLKHVECHKRLQYMCFYLLLGGTTGGGWIHCRVRHC